MNELSTQPIVATQDDIKKYNENIRMNREKWDWLGGPKKPKQAKNNGEEEKKAE